MVKECLLAMLKVNYYYHIRYIHRHRGTELLKIFPSKDHLHNPYPFYSTMRRYNPIAFDNRNNICGIFGYHDAKSILSSHKVTEANHLDPIVKNSLVSLLTSKLSSRLETRIEEITHDLLDKVIGQKKMDIMSHLARPLSIMVITELMGLPTEDIHIFERWTSDFTRSLSFRRDNTTRNIEMGV